MWKRGGASFRKFKQECPLSSKSNSTSDFKAFSKTRNDTRIVIVGAGLAGLTAANHLAHHGFRNTTVLEAINRLGGRIHSVPLGDTLCELGAKWINLDASSGSMYELIKKKIGLESTIEKTNVVFVTSDGSRIDQEIVEVAIAKFQQLLNDAGLENLYSADGKLQHENLNSLNNYLEAETKNITKDVFRSNEKVASDIFHSLNKELSSTLGTSLEFVSVAHLAKAPKSYFSSVYLAAGLSHISNILAENMESTNIKLGKPVGEIRWREVSFDQLPVVICIDGSSYQADHVICTLPLGVLKQFSAIMFNPRLPVEKMKAIENLGFGCPAKVFLEYDESIKSKVTVNIRPVWSTAERADDLEWSKRLAEIAKLPKSDRVLEIRVGGTSGDDIEKSKHEEIAEVITQKIRKCLRDPHFPFPKEILISNWSTNACFLGGRPFLSLESTPMDVNALAQPVGEETPRILFAGDATIADGFGTLDGARRSGIREAQRIVDFYNKKLL